MTEFEKMNSGQIFDGADAEIDAIRNRAAVLLKEINAATETEQRIALQKQLFASMGNSYIQPPFMCEFGKTISIGEETFINMNVVMLDGGAHYDRQSRVNWPELPVLYRFSFP